LELKLSDLTSLERYKLLVGLIVPRPIAWISTVNEAGVANCAPFSFFNGLSEDPPLCIVSFNFRSDGKATHTLKNIRRTQEFVVNTVEEETANAMHLSSLEYPEEESEFSKTGLTPAPCTLVGHPRIAEAAASFECKVERIIEYGPPRTLVIGEILVLHSRDGIVDPKSKRISEIHYRPVGRLFGDRYCTTRERFNLPGELPDSL
jgi:flavin reductase (DIM6/NTAB) family NADH-FMN oxidoreductase RutF